jgi:hypothetical protein
LPYLERYKSPRFFASEVTQIVPPEAPLFIYADSMHDFNYYLQRTVIPILRSSSAVDSLIASGQDAYVPVKERDLNRLPRLPREWIVLPSHDGGGTVWQLLELGSAPPK